MAAKQNKKKHPSLARLESWEDTADLPKKIQKSSKQNNDGNGSICIDLQIIYNIHEIIKINVIYKTGTSIILYVALGLAYCSQTIKTLYTFYVIICGICMYIHFTCTYTFTRCVRMSMLHRVRIKLILQWPYVALSAK